MATPTTPDPTPISVNTPPAGFAWRDAVSRAVRTFVEAWIGTFLLFITVPNVTNQVVNWDGLKSAVIAATVSAVITLLTFIYNYLENTGVAPSFLKSDPRLPNLNTSAAPGKKL